MIPQQYVILPLSLEDLNSRLETCQNSKELKEKLGADKWKKGIMFHQFISAVTPLIKDYKDLDSTKLNVFLKHVNRLFPDQTSQSDKAAQAIFWSQIKQQINTKIQHLQVKKEVPNYSGVSRVEAESNQCIPLSVKEALKEYEGHFLISPKKRLEKILAAEDVSTLENKAKRFQWILSFLILEQDLFEHLCPYVKGITELQKLIDQLREGSHSVKQLSRNKEVTFFEIPEKSLQTEEFAFWLNLSSYIYLHREKDKLYACFYLEEERADYKEIEKHLQDLKKQTKQEKIHFLIDHVLLELKRASLMNHLFKINKKLLLFRQNINTSLLIQESYVDNFECSVVPSSYIILSILNQHTKCLKEDNPRNIPEKDVEDFQQILSFWQSNREKQKALFHLVRGELDEMIRTTKNKTQFLPFTKDLNGDIRYPPAVLRKFFSKEEEKGKSTAAKIVSLDSSWPVAKPLASERKKKKVERKVRDSSSSTLKIDRELLTSDSSIMQSVESLSFLSIDSLSLTSPLLDKVDPKQEEYPGESFPYCYDQRVERWHRQSWDKSLNSKKFPEYNDSSAEYQEKMIIFHALHPLVDRFISLGIKGKWKNLRKDQEDIRFVIPAELTHKKIRYRGVITYAIDKKTQTCYHKFFSEKFERDILNEIITQTFDEHDFPELQKAKLSGRSIKPKSIYIKDVTIHQDAVFGNVRIYDRHKDFMIELFKTKFGNDW